MKLTAGFLCSLLLAPPSIIFAAEASKSTPATKPAPATKSVSVAKPALSKSEKAIYDHYLKMQAGLAADSVKVVKANATAIANSVRTNTKSFTPDVAKQADALAEAKDLKAARSALKDLSTSMIKLLGERTVAKGTYYEAYCPMVEASWLQEGKAIKNPYMGKAMLDCGEIKN